MKKILIILIVPFISFSQLSIDDENIDSNNTTIVFDILGKEYSYNQPNCLLFIINNLYVNKIYIIK